MDGSLVIGGYDAAKVKGGFIETPMTFDQHPCYLRLTIVGITVTTSFGRSTEILDSTTTLDSCIVPNFEVISLPNDIVTNFQNAAGSASDVLGKTPGIYVWGYTVGTDKV